MKTLKKRKILIIIMSLFGLFAIVIGIVSSLKLDKFYAQIDDIYGNENSKDFIEGFNLERPIVFASIAGAILLWIIFFIFIIFAIIYVLKKDEYETLKIWPYIVLIVLSILGILFFVIGVLLNKDMGKMPISINSFIDTSLPEIKININKIWEDDYKTIILISYIFRWIGMFVIFASSVFMLVIIKKNKNNIKTDY